MSRATRGCGCAIAVLIILLGASAIVGWTSPREPRAVRMSFMGGLGDSITRRVLLLPPRSGHLPRAYRRHSSIPFAGMSSTPERSTTVRKVR